MRSLLFTLALACNPVVDPPADDTDETDLPVDTDDTDDSDLPDDTGEDTALDTDDTDDTDVVVPACADASTFVTWTRDGGLSLAAVTVGPEINTYTWGIAVLPDDPAVLWAEHAGTLWRSADGGCTWEDEGTLPDVWWQLQALPGGRVWGWRENGGYLLRIQGTDWETTPFAGSVLGLGTDPADPDHIRFGASDGQLYDKVGTDRITSLGGPVPEGSAYAWAFDPADPDRAVAGMLSEGVWVTHDGGAGWTKATGFSANVNVFTVAWSPADPDVVWAEGLDIVESDATSGAAGRHLWRSEDGGLSFVSVVDPDEDITLTNGVPFAADPFDADVAWFSWGSSFQGAGTWLYRYDHGTGAVTFGHTELWHEYRAIRPSPVEEGLIYLGIVREQIR